MTLYRMLPRSTFHKKRLRTLELGNRGNLNLSKEYILSRKYGIGIKDTTNHSNKNIETYRNLRFLLLLF